MSGPYRETPEVAEQRPRCRLSLWVGDETLSIMFEADNWFEDRWYSAEEVAGRWVHKAVEAGVFHLRGTAFLPVHTVRRIDIETIS